MLGLRDQRALQAVGIEARHAVGHHAIERRGRQRIVIVRQIGAGDDERVAPVQHVGERVAERACRLLGLVSHHQRDDRRARREPLNERQLHFERMLARMRRGVLADDRRRFHELRCALVVDSGDAERRLEAAARIQRDAVERDVMGRPHENDDVEAAIAQQLVRVRRDRTRVHQPGVRRNERDQVAADLARGRREMTIDGRRQRRRGAGIPGPGDGRPSNVRHG